MLRPLYALCDILSHGCLRKANWEVGVVTGFGRPPGIADVTSSYLEGTHNALAAFGYNRDGKKGKRQIVIGLLCNEDGQPVSIEVFPGNTHDPQTFAAQINKVKARFGVTEITFVGDRGMLKGQQIEDLAQQGPHDITAITIPQIDKLLRTGTLHMDLFDQEVAEVLADE